MSFNYSEFIAFRDKFEKMTNEFDTFLKKFLLRQALDVLRKTKLNTPVDTSLLINSWTVGNQAVAIGKKTNDKGRTQFYQADSAFTSNATLDSVIRQGNKLIITISNVVEYASYVEYGHMSRRDKKWVDGKFMCTLALKDIQDKIPQRFANSFETWFKNMMR